MSPTGDFPIDPQSFVKAKQPVCYVSENTDLVKLYGKRNARRIQQGKICGEDGVLYDMSLWKACFQVHKQDAVISIVLLVLGSTCFPLKAERHSTEHVDSIEMALPLMSRVIIVSLQLVPAAARAEPPLPQSHSLSASLY